MRLPANRLVVIKLLTSYSVYVNAFMNKGTDNGEVLYSTTVKISLSTNGISAVTVLPNPVSNTMQINIASNADKDVQVLIYDVTGKLMRTTSSHVTERIFNH